MLKTLAVLTIAMVFSLPAFAQFAPFPQGGAAPAPAGGQGFPAPAGGGAAPAETQPAGGGFGVPGVPEVPGVPGEGMDPFGAMEMAGMFQPAIAVQNNMIFIASGGMLTVYQLNGNALSKVAEAPYTVAAPMPGMGGAPGAGGGGGFGGGFGGGGFR